MSVTRTILVPPTVTDKQLDELDARGIRPIIDYGGAVYDENGHAHEIVERELVIAAGGMPVDVRDAINRGDWSES